MRNKFEGLDLLICPPGKWKGPEDRRRMMRCMLFVLDLSQQPLGEKH